MSANSLKKRLRMPGKAGIRRGVLAVHLWLGVIIGLYFSAMGLTGSVLVFEKELTHITAPETAHVTPPTAGAAPMPIEEIQTRLKAELPKASPGDLAFMIMPEAAGGAYTLSLGDGGEKRYVTVDPYTGRILRNVNARATLVGFCQEFHIYLLNGQKGLLVNGYGALLTAILLLSGLWLWWPATVRQIRSRITVKWGAGAKRVTHDLHNTFGIYTLPLLLMVTLTGAMFAFFEPVQKAVYALTHTAKPAKPAPIIPPANAKRLPADTLVATANAITPEARMLSFIYPTKPAQPFTCYKQRSLGFLPYIQVSINPYTGKVLRVSDDATAPLGDRVLRALSSLHFGWWGGITTKILYSLLGLTPITLFVTGLLMYLRKRRAKSANKRRRETTGDPNTEEPEAVSHRREEARV